MSFYNSRFSRTVRYFLHKIRLPKDKENIRITTENIKSSAVLTGVNLWVLVGAIFIASLGLNTNSTAVIIGAMLISPLMGPIMGFGLGLGTNDFFLLKKSVRNFVVMVVMSVTTSTIFFLLSPVKEAGSELLGRTSPTIYDVLIALFGGLAGIVAGASKLRGGNVVPGVAIATALMPPLCTLGYGISHLNWQYIIGASYLFMINSVFIALATYFVVNLMGFPHVKQANPKLRKRIRVIIPLIIILMIAPSIYLTFHIIKKYFYTESAQKFLKQELQDGDHVVVTSKFDYDAAGSKLEVVLVGESFDSLGTTALQKKMANYGLRNCELILYQGADPRAAAKGLFDELNSDVELTRSSLKEIYLTLDSLKRRVSKVAVLDSLQADIARQVLKKDSTLKHLSLQRTFSFNPVRNANDTLWTATATFKNGITFPRQVELLALLKARLKSTEVKLQIE